MTMLGGVQIMGFRALGFAFCCLEPWICGFWGERVWDGFVVAGARIVQASGFKESSHVPSISYSPVRPQALPRRVMQLELNPKLKTHNR